MSARSLVRLIALAAASAVLSAIAFGLLQVARLTRSPSLADTALALSLWAVMACVVGLAAQVLRLFPNPRRE